MRSRFPNPSFLSQVRFAQKAVVFALTVFGLASYAAADGGSVDFTRDVRPILEKHCFSCHGVEKQKGGLRLDNRKDAFTPGESGEKAISPHAPDKSLLLQLVLSSDDSERMPQRADALADNEVDVLRRWILQGAGWPEEATPVAGGIREMIVTAKDRDHWAYRALTRPALPEVRHATWVRNPIDRFVLARLEKSGAVPAPEAPETILRRRLSYALTGLPPSDPTKSVSADELLARPAYGEHWARLWLDVARYADSDGYEGDRDRKESWRYRDFVIRALNADLPYNEFVTWQVAGDEVAPGKTDALIATGFLALGPFLEIQSTESFEYREKARYDQLDDIVSTTASAFLGLTVACARCHDHKFDAIPTRDYYALAAAFAGGERGNFPIERAQAERDRLLARAREQWIERRMEELGIDPEERELFRHPLNGANNTQRHAWEKWGDKMKPTEAMIRASLPPATAEEIATLDQQSGAGSADRTFAWRDRTGDIAPNWLLGRGDAMKKVEPQALGFLQVLTTTRQPADYRAGEEKKISGHTSGQRAALAAWLTDVEHGAGALLARVIVNRLWQGQFGEGLVHTPNDFGIQGERPTNPELLDWLASELVSSGWSLKHLQRLIVDSATWRQSDAAQGDERMFARRRPLRMGADALRDSMLALAGKLQPDVGGPAFRPFIPAEAIATRSRDKYPADITDGPAVWRRSIYHFMKRSVRFPLEEVFDAPDTTASSGRRIETTVPTQQLTLLNDDFVRSRAREFAQRLQQEETAGDERIRRGYLLALGRAPSAAELADSADFIAHTSLTDWCHALFTLNEFLYVD